jgi:polar amino acid transport system substrate-binding protein
MRFMRGLSFLAAVAFPAGLALAACNTGSSGPTFPAGSVCASTASTNSGDLLGTICTKGKIVVVTDPAYPPQSKQNPDGSMEGFDVDVANEVAKRLGVTVDYQPTTNFDLVVAGGWAGRWDLSVGSVTVTTERKDKLDFTQPYYFTPAQMGVVTDTGITSLDGLAGKTVCVGNQTTYLFWLQGTLQLGDGSAVTPLPAGIKSTTFETDTQCADAVKSGRRDFEGWLTASETLVAAIAAGAPFTPVGDPVFFEPLAIGLDKSGAVHAKLLAEIDKIIGAMHTDGTLTAFSKKWYQGRDLSVRAGQ